MRLIPLPRCVTLFIYFLTRGIPKPYLCHIYIYILQKIGAINNIVRRPDGKLMAFNTDYIGAITAIEDGLRGFLSYLMLRHIQVLMVYEIGLI